MNANIKYYYKIINQIEYLVGFQEYFDTNISKNIDQMKFSLVLYNISSKEAYFSAPGHLNDCLNIANIKGLEIENLADFLRGKSIESNKKIGFSLDTNTNTLKVLLNLDHIKIILFAVELSKHSDYKKEILKVSLSLYRQKLLLLEANTSKNEELKNNLHQKYEIMSSKVANMSNLYISKFCNIINLQKQAIKKLSSTTKSLY